MADEQAFQLKVFADDRSQLVVFEYILDVNIGEFIHGN